MKHLTDGDLGVLLKEDTLPVSKYIGKVAAPIGAFLLQIQLQCNCPRLVHYRIKNAELVLKSDKFGYQFQLQATLLYFRYGKECNSSLVVPDATWRDLPTVVMPAAYTHTAYDRAAAERLAYLGGQPKCSSE